MSETPNVAASGAVKNDVGKARYDLIPPRSMEQFVFVWTMGAGKYGDHNWAKGMPWSRIIAAMMRHFWAWMRGETHDPVDGQHHLAALAWGCFVLMEYERIHPELDDRHFKEPK